MINNEPSIKKHSAHPSSISCFCRTILHNLFVTSPGAVEEKEVALAANSQGQGWSFLAMLDLVALASQQWVQQKLQALAVQAA